ncbi:MAG: tetratricopeptide repeat protein [Acidobacteriota bacterium]|nr:tetratricopeptide repeat protein [Blastocatellia bacterium]MDW8413477.1 tetratricopeptide repeat protein [Acidobacteriota bacterium]
MSDLDRPQHLQATNETKDSILSVTTEQEFAELIRKTAEGEISFQQFLSLTNQDVENITIMAHTLYEEDRLDEALVLIEGLIALNDKNSVYYNAAGAIFIRQEKYDEALAALNKAIELDPNNLDAYVNRGEVYLVTAHLEEAAADFEKAISMDPREENPSANRARQLVWGMYQLLRECEKEGFLDPDFEIDVNS